MFETLTTLLAAVPDHWRVLGALAVLAVFLLDLAVAARRFRAEPPGETRPLRRLRHLVRGLRAALVGGAALAVAVGVLTDAGTLVGLALVIGLEELYETTMVLAVLRHGLRVETEAAGAAA